MEKKVIKIRILTGSCLILAPLSAASQTFRNAFTQYSDTLGRLQNALEQRASFEELRQKAESIFSQTPSAASGAVPERLRLTPGSSLPGPLEFHFLAPRGRPDQTPQLLPLSSHKAKGPDRLVFIVGNTLLGGLSGAIGAPGQAGSRPHPVRGAVFGFALGSVTGGGSIKNSLLGGLAGIASGVAGARFSDNSFQGFAVGAATGLVVGRLLSLLIR